MKERGQIHQETDKHQRQRRRNNNSLRGEIRNKLAGYAQKEGRNDTVLTEPKKNEGQSETNELLTDVLWRNLATAHSRTFLPDSEASSTC